MSAKTSFHGSLNPKAQFRDVLSVEQVLGAREISYPLTLAMCSPIGDGSAAAVIVSEKIAKRLGMNDMVRVRTSVLRSGWDIGENEPGVTETVAKEAYEEAGIGPEDLDVIELHDASSHSRLGGKTPVNPSGGLLRKGHPVGATGLAQIAELTDQLRGRADKRQVSGARVALAENGGGYIGSDAAAMVISVLEK